MKGIRKLLVIFGAFVALTIGLVLAKDIATYGAFAGAIVGAGGWFFKSNVDEHKAVTAKE